MAKKQIEQAGRDGGTFGNLSPGDLSRVAGGASRVASLVKKVDARVQKSFQGNVGQSIIKGVKAVGKVDATFSPIVAGAKAGIADKRAGKSTGTMVKDVAKSAGKAAWNSAQVASMFVPGLGEVSGAAKVAKVGAEAAKVGSKAGTMAKVAKGAKSVFKGVSKGVDKANDLLDKAQNVQAIYQQSNNGQ